MPLLLLDSKPFRISSTASLVYPLPPIIRPKCPGLKLVEATAKTNFIITKLRIYILSSTELLSMQEKEEEIEREETTFYMAPPRPTWASWSKKKIFRIFFSKKNSKKVEWLTWSGVHLKQFIEIDYSSNSNDNK